MKEFEQGTPEWVQFRRDHIGSSDAPVIMGVSPWKTPLQLWEEKLGLRSEEVNEAMRRGLAMESQARTEFEMLTGLSVFPRVIVHPTLPWMMASLDGIDIEEENIVEIKCPGIEDHKTAMERNVPVKYYPQLQHIMCVAEVQSMYYFSYRMGSMILLEVARDDEYIDKMIEAERDFYDSVRDLKAPEYSAKDHVHKDDIFWQEKAERWLYVSKSLDRLRSEESVLRQDLITMCGQSNCRGAGVKLTRSVRKGNIDYSAIEQIKHVDLEKYRKEPIESWRISIDKN